MSEFFNNLTLPSVLAKQISVFGGESSNAELLRAIKCLKCNKTPGLDRYATEFYLKICICPLLQAMYNESLSTGHLPSTLRQAVIPLLPKGSPICLHLPNFG